jgi:hypothetical protein
MAGLYQMRRDALFVELLKSQQIIILANGTHILANHNILFQNETLKPKRNIAAR